MGKRGYKPRTASRAVLLKLLDGNRSGMTVEAISQAMAIRYNTVTELCSEMARDGLIVGRMGGTGKRHNQKTWFRPECAPPEELPWKSTMVTIKPRAAVKWKPDAEVRMSPKFKGVQTCPGFSPVTYRPEVAEPFFSAMRPGSYLSTGTAIERAYG